MTIWVRLRVGATVASLFHCGSYNEREEGKEEGRGTWGQRDTDHSEQEVGWGQDVVFVPAWFLTRGRSFWTNHMFNDSGRCSDVPSFKVCIEPIFPACPPALMWFISCYLWHQEGRFVALLVSIPSYHYTILQWNISQIRPSHTFLEDLLRVPWPQK